MPRIPRCISAQETFKGSAPHCLTKVFLPQPHARELTVCFLEYLLFFPEIFLARTKKDAAKSTYMGTNLKCALDMQKIPGEVAFSFSLSPQHKFYMLPIINGRDQMVERVIYKRDSFRCFESQMLRKNCLFSDYKPGETRQLKHNSRLSPQKRLFSFQVPEKASRQFS